MGQRLLYCVVFVISQGSLLGQLPSNYSYRIIYTGRFLGYSRVPDVQYLNAPSVANQYPDNEGVASNSPVAAAFVDVLAKLPQDEDVRLAMGDNMAPELDARTFSLKHAPAGVQVCGSPWTLSPSVRLPKDFLFYYGGGKFSPAGWYLNCQKPDVHQQTPFSTSAFSDNVADFFVKAKYDAIVPGKHDFFFGAEYLREIGEYLHNKGVRMLGSNLVVVTSRAPGSLNVEPRIPERFSDECHEDTGSHPCYHTNFGLASVDLPDDVLPFKQKFVIKNARLVFRPHTCTPAQPNTCIAFRSDELKGLTRNQVEYKDLINTSEVWISVEGKAQTRMDPRMVLKKPTKQFRLRNAEEVCNDHASVSLASTCKSIFTKSKNGIFDPQKENASPDVTFVWDEPENNHGGGPGRLAPGKNHAICTYVHQHLDSPESWNEPWEDKDYPTCKQFSVEEPFFWADKLPVKSAEPPVPEVEPQPGDFCENLDDVPCPFTLVKRGSQTVAVFGIVAPDLLSNVGLINSAWRNENDAWDTTTKVISVDYALQQTMELCNAIDACRSAPKILMAQMSSARASQVIANFRKDFDVVISQSENEHPTRNRTVELASDRPQFLLTPPVPFDQTGDYSEDQTSPTASDQKTDPGPGPQPLRFQPVLYRATITKAKCLTANVSWTLKNESVTGTKAPDEKPAQIDAVTVHPMHHTCLGAESDQQCMDLERVARLALLPARADNTAYPNGGLPASYHLKQATLLAMRETLHTDVAMLQDRDFYEADRFVYAQIAPEELQNQLELIVWKEDFAVRLHLKGGTIKKLLKQSGAFGELDHDSLATEIEKNRTLVYLGIYNDPKDPNSYLINGAPLDDNKLYTVAASDFLAAGDTGYSDLATPDVFKETRVEDFEKPYLIAGLVCRLLVSKLPNGGDPKKLCLNDNRGEDYFDPTESRPFDNTGGYDTRQHYRAFFRQFRALDNPKSQAEASVQHRPFWYLNLENLDFTYNGVYVNHIHQTLTNLAGVSASGVSQAGSNSIGSDHRLRLVRDWDIGTVYLLSDSSFLRTSTSTSSVPSVVSNMLGSEAGGTLRLLPARQRPSWLSAQASVRYEREIVQPPPTPLKTPALLLPTPQISTIYGRFGLREELGPTYTEVGFEEIDSRGVLQHYAFTSAGSPTVYCQTGASGYLCGPDSTADSRLNTTPIASVSGLASASITPSTTSYLTGGAYLNLNWKFPIWSRQDAIGGDQSWYFVLTNKGDLYFNSHTDTPVQTRYLDKLTPALSFPIWGKLSFTPKLDIILYENKINRFHYRALQPGFSINYSFVRREGMNWTSVLAYGAQATVQPTTAGH